MSRHASEATAAATRAALADLLPSWELHLRAERKSSATLKTYGDDVRRFLAFCQATQSPRASRSTTPRGSTGTRSTPAPPVYEWFTVEQAAEPLGFDPDALHALILANGD